MEWLRYIPWLLIGIPVAWAVIATAAVTIDRFRRPIAHVKTLDAVDWYLHLAPQGRESLAFVPVGFLLAWLVARDLTAEAVRDETDDDSVAKCRARFLSGPALYEKLGGTLTEDMLTPEGAAFLRHYLRRSHRSSYWRDFRQVFEVAEPNELTISDTWPNADRIGAIVDTRFRSWHAQR